MNALASPLVWFASVTPVVLASGTFPADLAYLDVADMPAAATTQLGTSTEPATSSSLPEYEMFAAASARLAQLRGLDDDHDGEGAEAPSQESFDLAAQFVQFLPFFAPDPSIGVDSDGNAVVEFHDESEFGQVVFHPGRLVEVFYDDNSPSGPVAFQGSVDDPAIRSRFRDAFDFSLEA
jgi:hypothetical protein